MPLVVVEDDTQQHVHEEEHTKEDKDNKVNRVPGARIVGIEHDIGVVRRRYQNDELPEGLAQRYEGCVARHGPIEDEQAHC